MKQNERRNWLKHWDFILIDLICLHVSYIITHRIIRGRWNAYANRTYLINALLFSLSMTLVILFFDQYHGILKRKRFDEFMAVLKLIGETYVVLLIFLFAFQLTSAVSRIHTVAVGIAFVFIDYSVRQAHKRNLHQHYSNEITRRNIVLFTGGELVPKTMERLFPADSWRDFDISSIVLLDKDEGTFSDYDGIPVLPLNDDTILKLSHQWVDEILILKPDFMPYPEELINTFTEMGITVNYTTESLVEPDYYNRKIQKIGNIFAVSSSVKTITPGQAMVKRGFDIIVSFFGCLFTGILAIFLGPLIKKADPGPIFFSQTRIGQNGRQFKLYKFRSMYMDAEERKKSLMEQNRFEDGMMFKIDDDPRILGSEKKRKDGKPGGIGNFMRNFSLDEFPQFYNVLRGNMSVVGWRPCTLDEWEKYKLKHRIRATMKPGITGMWQVSGRSTITDFDEVVRLDKEYIDNWSLALDIKIILKTIVAVITRKGAL